MVTYVLDASALLRFLLAQCGAERVMQIFAASREGSDRILMSAVTWGEVIGKIHKSQGRLAAESLESRLSRYGITVVSATAERASRAARIKVDRNIPYADCFCVELAGDSPEYILITADFDFKPAEKDISIEFLPPNAVN